MKDASFRCHMSLMMLIAAIAAQAADDARYGIRKGWLTPGLQPKGVSWKPTGTRKTTLDDVLDAVSWLHSADAELACDLIATICGREMITADGLRSKARNLTLHMDAKPLYIAGGEERALLAGAKRKATIAAKAA